MTRGTGWKLAGAIAAIGCWVAAYYLYDTWHFGSETLQHAAAATVIALFVAIAVEHESQRRIDAIENTSKTRLAQAERHARDRAEITERAARERIDKERSLLEEHARSVTEASLRGVAKNVFGAFHSSEVLEEAIQSIFSETLLRESYVNETIFQRLPAHPNAVKIIQITRYVVVNPSKFLPAVFAPKFAADDTSPLYLYDKERRSPVLTSLAVGDQSFSQEEIADFPAEKQRQIENHELDYVLIQLGKYDIPPGGKLPVHLIFEHVEALDGEWTNRVFLPTKGLSIRVRNEFGPNFAVFLGALFRENFGRVRYLNPDRSEWERSYEGVILPHSGWVLRWNNVEKDSA